MADAWEQYFQPGETLLWEGAPKPGVHGWPKIIGVAIFGLIFLFAGLGVFATGVAKALLGEGWFDYGLALFILLFSLPFVAFGASAVFGGWWTAAKAHSRVRYAVSTRCAYIAKSYRTRSIESYPILAGTALGLLKGRRSDTVWFHVRSEKDSDGDRFTTRIAFENIADGETAYRLLRSIQMGLT